MALNAELWLLAGSFGRVEEVENNKRISCSSLPLIQPSRVLAAAMAATTASDDSSALTDRTNA